MPESRVGLVSVLLLEPQNLFRRTVVGVAAELDLVDIAEAASIESAHRLLDRGCFDAMVIALDDQGAAVAMIKQVRAGAYRTSSDVPVVVLTDLCDQRRIAEMKAMNVRRILLKPFKVKGVLETISDLCVA